MDLKRLKYFVAVAEAGGFTRAAQRLHISQPPLSRRIQELEAEVGAQLIDRTARPQRLTEAGRLLFDQARPIISRMEQLEASMRLQVANVRPRLRMAAPPSAFPHRLPEAIRRFRQAAPDAEISLIELNSLEQVEALKGGLIDVGVGRVRIEDPAIRRTVLANEPLVAALPSDHILAQAGGAVGLEALGGETLVLFPNDARPSFGDFLLSLLHDRGLNPPAVIEVRDLHTALMLVAAGEGVCLTPQAASYVSHPLLVFRGIREPVSAPLILCSREGDANPALVLISEVLGAVLTEDPVLGAS